MAAAMSLTTAILYVPGCASGTSKVLRNFPVEAFSAFTGDPSGAVIARLSSRIGLCSK